MHFPIIVENLVNRTLRDGVASSNDLNYIDYPNLAQHFQKFDFLLCHTSFEIIHLGENRNEPKLSPSFSTQY